MKFLPAAMPPPVLEGKYRELLFLPPFVEGKKRSAAAGFYYTPPKKRREGQATAFCRRDRKSNKSGWSKKEEKKAQGEKSKLRGTQKGGAALEKEEGRPPSFFPQKAGCAYEPQKEGKKPGCWLDGVSFSFTASGGRRAAEGSI